jgi:hypothetical protein
VLCFINLQNVFGREVGAPLAAEMYYALCAELAPEEKAATQRAMGMKMEQLKAELSLLDHAHDDD